MGHRKRVLGVLLLGTVLGCGSGCFGGASAPPRFYTLAPLAALQADADPGGAGRGAAIILGPVTMPGYLDRIQIVTDPMRSSSASSISGRIHSRAAPPASWARTSPPSCARIAFPSSPGGGRSS